MKGYAGIMLRIDLSSRRVTKEEIPGNHLRQYIGGQGLATRYLYDEIPVDADVFDGRNKLFFSVGPLNGGFFPTSGRFNVSCRSPLTGIWLDSTSSGKFGYQLKKAGYDAIIIEGKSDRPVYVYINNDRVEIRDASRLWGKKVSESLSLLSDECSLEKGSAILIGPSGERMLPMASIITDRSRAAGRGGAGAVMGSKRLKAVFIHGDKDLETADTESWKEGIRTLTEKIIKNPISNSLKAFGTGGAMARAAQTGDTPVKNWRLGTWDGFMKISGPTMAKTILVQHANPCHACPIHCARHVEIKEGNYKMKDIGPEYETLGSFGSMCLNDNLESIAHLNILCREYGIDTISVGASIAFAMEAYEKGIITRADTDGIDLVWGDAGAIVAMTEKILKGEGFGAVLAQGVRKAAAVLGKGSEEFAVHVKGLELPMHDPRAFFEFGPTYATSSRGGCHTHGYAGAFHQNVIPEAGYTKVLDPHATEGKGLVAKIVQDFSCVIQSSVICMFTLYSLGVSDIAAAISASTGFACDAQQLLKAGERIFNLQRAFNNRLGITRKDDTLPKRLLTSTEGGPVEGFVPNLEEQLKEYYQARGWEADGRPSLAKLRELDLDFVIGDLYGNQP